MRDYRIVINGQEVRLCAKSLNISRKRCLGYLNSIMKKTKEEYGSYRFFWGDVIMLNMLTNRILYHADPRHIERALTPKEERDNE